MTSSREGIFASAKHPLSLMRFNDTSQSLLALPLALKALQTERMRVTVQKEKHQGKNALPDVVIRYNNAEMLAGCDYRSSVAALHLDHNAVPAAAVTHIARRTI
jgi:hypothetical protein